MDINRDESYREEKNKKKGRKKGLKLYAVFITAVAVIAVGIIIYQSFFAGNNETAQVSGEVTGDSMYSPKQVAELIEAEHGAVYDKAYEEGQGELLKVIQDKMSTGTTTLSLLRELYPDKLVYNETGGYVFGDILDIPKNSFKENDFFLNKETGILEYAGEEDIKTYKGIDVSKFQGDIDWSKVKADGVDYVFIRVGIRGYGTGAIVEDEKFHDNIKGALEADLKVGVYFFSEAVNTDEAVEEAEFVLERIKDYNVTLPVVIDIEEIPGEDGRNEALSKEELTQVCLAFMEKIENSGYSPMLYGNIKCLVSMVDIEKLSKYDMWYAFYSDEIYIPYEVAGWQYSSEGKVDGISGNCDLNIFFKEWD